MSEPRPDPPSCPPDDVLAALAAGRLDAAAPWRGRLPRPRHDGRPPVPRRLGPRGGHPEATPLPADCPARWLGCAADGALALGFRDGALLVYRAATPAAEPRTIFRFADADDPGRVAAVGGNGRWVAAAAGGRLVVADRATGAVRWEARLPGAPAALAFTLGDHGLVTANPDGTVFLFHLTATALR